MFTDEPAILGRRGKGAEALDRWIFEWYRKFGGSELDLAALWFEAGEETGKRRLYKQAVNALLEQSYYRQISEWCAGTTLP